MSGRGLLDLDLPTVALGFKAKVGNQPAQKTTDEHPMKERTMKNPMRASPIVRAPLMARNSLAWRFQGCPPTKGAVAPGPGNPGVKGGTGAWPKRSSPGRRTLSQKDLPISISRRLQGPHPGHPFQALP